MTELSRPTLRKWRYGMHPNAKGSQVASLGRVDLTLGEALRIEMVDADPGAQAIVHVQYYVSTEAGPWALWITCARAELADREADLHDLTPPFAS